MKRHIIASLATLGTVSAIVYFFCPEVENRFRQGFSADEFVVVAGTHDLPAVSLEFGGVARCRVDEATAHESIVIIRSYERKNDGVVTWSGSGGYIDEHYILSAYHVMDDEHAKNEPIFVSSPQIPERLASLVAYNEQLDIALLYTESPAVPLSVGIEPAAGDSLQNIGYPSGDFGMIDSTLINLFWGGEQFRHSYINQKGISGGPVLNSCGVVGVNHSFNHAGIQTGGRATSIGAVIEMVETFNADSATRL